MLDLLLLKTLCDGHGLSGCEKGIRDIIIKEIKGYADSIRVDSAGNLIVFKKGEKAQEDGAIAYFAHLDEVGFMITGHDEDGLLSFDTVGGVDVSVMLSKRVEFYCKNERVSGVIGSKAVHILSSDEKEKLPKVSSLRIDIGAADKNEAQKTLPIGSLGTFKSELYVSHGVAVGKALDDRAGCFLLINMIKGTLSRDAYFVFTVEEECGLRGAFSAAAAISPTRAIVVDCTTASDVYGIEGEKRICEQGKGAVVSLADRSTLYDKELIACLCAAAEERGIPLQKKMLASGGNDSAAIQRAGAGRRVMALSLPTRYIHSPSSALRISDMEAALSLLLLTNEVL